MKVQTKLVLTLGLTMAIIALLAISTHRVLVINYIEQEETQIIHQNVDRALAILQREESSLESAVQDWSYWDDTYQFFEDQNRGFINANLQESTLESLNLDFMVFIDRNGNIVHSKMHDSEGSTQQITTENLSRKLNLEKNIDTLILQSEPSTGLLIFNERPVLLSLSPVSTSDQLSISNGLLVIGRYVDQKFSDYLNEILQVNIQISSTTKSEILDVANQDYKMLAFDDRTIWIQKSSHRIKSYIQLDDINKNSEIIITLDMNRQLYQNGDRVLHYFGVVFSASLFIVVVIFLMTFDGLVINRLSKLHHFIETVGTKKNTAARITLPGNDELSMLSVTINKMLEELDKSYSDAKANDERFKLIMEATNDGYFDAKLLMDTIYISPDWLKYIGYTSSDGHITSVQHLEYIYPEDKGIYTGALNECLNGNSQKLTAEYRILGARKNLIWISIRGKVVEFDQSGKPARLIGTISDITSRKKYEEENIFLSQTDVVTNLKNRTYIETILEQSNECKMCNSSIILGDVNGLKLINDSFGHQEGDKLLRAIGDILQKCCSPSDIPARWGGDEFIIYIKDKSTSYVDNLIYTIKKECSSVTGYPTPISIALGRASKDKTHTDMDSVLKLAEERMYRNKLLESRSVRSSVLYSLEQSLHEKHIETEAHTKRIKQICTQIGITMGESQEVLDELALLGALHDIGKIGIPENILLKTDKLTQEEWDIMKSHTEIGYRIAMAIPELTHIADKILSHHERYDGTGYPQGLKGSGIPKLSRLVAIVDSFDVMTHDRHYKKAMSIEDAIQELQSCSGTQFDPAMVNMFINLFDENLLSLAIDLVC